MEAPGHSAQDQCATDDGPDADDADGHGDDSGCSRDGCDWPFQRGQGGVLKGEDVVQGLNEHSSLGKGIAFSLHLMLFAKAKVI